MNETYKKLKKSFFHKNHFVFIVGFIFTLISALEMMIISYLLGAVIDVISLNDINELLKLLTYTIFFAVTFTLIELIKERFCAIFYRRAILQYSKEAFNGIVSKNISAFSKENTGTYISLLSNDITNIQNGYLVNLFGLGQQIVMFVGAITMMLIYSRWLTLTAVGFTLIPVAVAVLMSGKLTKKSKAVSDKSEVFVVTLKDILSGFSVIKSFKSEKKVEKRFYEASQAQENAKFNRRWWSNMITIFSSVGGVIMQFGVFFVGALLAIKGKITAGTILVFVNLCNCFINPIQTIPQYFGEIASSKTLIAKLAKTLDENSERSGDVVVPSLEEGIILSNVSFAYEENKPVLKNVSLNLQKGKKYAIVGNSGSGKTTILNLLMGAYDNYEGSITFDGKELKTISPESIYDLLTSISQNVFLFDDTIKNNITMFGDYDEDIISSSIKNAGLADFISKNGMDYTCGENGCNLSGGEKQRVSIARCLVRKTPILLLDEATAALDNKTSFEIINSILDLNDLTRLVITHRLEKGLLERYDSIFVLWNGAVVEQGTFEELMKQKGRFYSLYTLSE